MIQRLAKAVLLAGLPFGIALGLFFWQVTKVGPFLAAVAGLLAGPLFGLSIGAFLESQRRNRRLPESAEPFIRDGPANHLRGAEGVGGWLYLTASRLIFVPHRLNIQKSELSIPLDRIQTVKRRRTALLIPNGLEIIIDARPERFVVQRPADWVRSVVLATHNRGRDQ